MAQYVVNKKRYRYHGRAVTTRTIMRDGYVAAWVETFRTNSRTRDALTPLRLGVHDDAIPTLWPHAHPATTPWTISQTSHMWAQHGATAIDTDRHPPTAKSRIGAGFAAPDDRGRHRSARLRLLCTQGVVGSNPSISTRN